MQMALRVIQKNERPGALLDDRLCQRGSDRAARSGQQYTTLGEKLVHKKAIVRRAGRGTRNIPMHPRPHHYFATEPAEGAKPSVHGDVRCFVASELRAAVSQPDIPTSRLARRLIAALSSSSTSFPNWDCRQTMFHFESSRLLTFAFSLVNRSAH
jgi:hypothetical protein